MPLEIQILQNLGTQNTGAITVKLIGSLDTATAPELERQLGPVLARCGKDLVFDLAELEVHQQRRPARVFHRPQTTQGTRRPGILHQHAAADQRGFRNHQGASRRGVFANEAEFDAYLAARQKMVEEGQ